MNKYFSRLKSIKIETITLVENSARGTTYETEELNSMMLYFILL